MAIKVGSKAPAFDLPGVDGRNYSLASFADKEAVVVIFSCNHCPYVVANEDRMMQIQSDYAARGVQLVAICSNNAATHPADSFENMKQRAAEKGFNFPYLRDESQEVARAYGASVTPEVFVVDKTGTVVYHGRIDDNAMEPAKVKRHDLREALDELLAGKPISVTNTEPVGCSVKWK
jgi:peroxiredoxin